MPPDNGQDDQKKTEWITKIGEYRYFSYVLADFDPVRADQIFDNPAHVIAEAYVSKMCYSYVDPEQVKNYGR